MSTDRCRGRIIASDATDFGNRFADSLFVFQGLLNSSFESLDLSRSAGRFPGWSLQGTLPSTVRSASSQSLCAAYAPAFGELLGKTYVFNGAINGHGGTVSSLNHNDLSWNTETSFPTGREWFACVYAAGECTLRVRPLSGSQVLFTSSAAVSQANVPRAWTSSTSPRKRSQSAPTCRSHGVAHWFRSQQIRVTLLLCAPS